MAISEYLVGNARPGPDSWEPYQNQLVQFFSAMEQAGYPVRAYSNYRPIEYQAKLFDAAVKKYGSPEAADNWVARPSAHAPHYNGASDLSFNGVRLGSKGTEEATAMAHKIASQYGLHFRMDHEPWHIEPIKGGGGHNHQTPPAAVAKATTPQPIPSAPTGQMDAIPTEMVTAAAPAVPRPANGYEMMLAAYRQQLAANTPGKPTSRRSETFDIIRT